MIYLVFKCYCASPYLNALSVCSSIALIHGTAVGSTYLVGRVLHDGAVITSGCMASYTPVFPLHHVLAHCLPLPGRARLLLFAASCSPYMVPVLPQSLHPIQIRAAHSIQPNVVANLFY